LVFNGGNYPRELLVVEKVLWCCDIKGSISLPVTARLISSGIIWQSIKGKAKLACKLAYILQYMEVDLC
jgi:DNA mismatch repair protein MutH